jgi:N-acetylglucosamine malate deacetylase 2
MPGELAVCAVFAHPDDESFGVAGTFALLAAQGVRTGLLCATRGEAGMTGGLVDSPAELAEVRTEELTCAAAAMGLTDLILLDFGDGLAEEWDMAALRDQIEVALARLRPAAVITFDEYGVTRHPDHVAVHRATREVVLARGADLGVRRLYYQVVTCAREASPEGPSIACVAPEDVDISVDICGFEAVKRAALRCHRTQAADTAHLLDQPAGSLTTEHYVLAWAADGWQPPAGVRDLLASLEGAN